MRLKATDRAIRLDEGFADHRQDPRHQGAGDADLARIAKAYKAAKAKEPDSAPPFRIKGLWAEWLAVNYSALIDALYRENIGELRRLFENLNREQFAVGTGGSGYDSYVKYRGSPLGRAYIKVIWCAYRDRYLSANLALDALRLPLVGNPAGVPLGDSVVQINAFRHAYHGHEMRRWLKDTHAPTIAEIGSGFGGQAYQTVRTFDHSACRYLCFDIPEVAAACSYYLMSSLPHKRVRLFGEGAITSEAAEEFDIAVFPHFSITQLQDDSIDLFHNANSFSEMDESAVTAYLEVMERCCRQYISHINHDTKFTFRNPDGSVSRNLVGSRIIPDPARFRRVFRKHRTFALPEDASFPSFEYLYERIPPGR